MSVSREERALYNPAFTALLCTRAVQGHEQQYNTPCPLPVAVVAGIMALQPAIRAVLPSTLNSGLMKWLGTNDAVRVAMTRNAASLAAVARCVCSPRLPAARRQPWRIFGSRRPRTPPRPT
ncbi:three component ABC system middle component [Streptomyces sp. NPDC059525]|uniref:three component ABC system middle component n=1 Tax=Streptomyces sp. NPDC059525 TaxID=3346857 RepID=UPI0036822FF8